MEDKSKLVTRITAAAVVIVVSVAVLRFHYNPPNSHKAVNYNNGSRLVSDTSLPDIQYPQNSSSTLTDSFARKTFSSYVALAQSGELGTQVQTAVVNSLLLDIKSSLPNLNKYTLTDIKLASTISAEIVNSYKNRVKSIHARYYLPIMGDEFNILEESLKENNPSKLEPLGQVESNYVLFYQELLTTPVPTTLAKVHLNTINSLYVVSEGVKRMRVAFSDSLTALVGTEIYVASMQKLLDNLKIIDEATY